MYKEINDLMDQHSQLVESLAERLLFGAKLTGREIYYKYKTGGDEDLGFFIGCHNYNWGVYHCIGKHYHPMKGWSQNDKMNFVRCLDSFTDLLIEASDCKKEDLINSIRDATSFISKMEFKYGTFERITISKYDDLQTTHLGSITLTSKTPSCIEGEYISLNSELYKYEGGKILFSFEKHFCGERVGPIVFFVTTSAMKEEWLRTFIFQFLQNQFSFEPKAKLDVYSIESFDTFNGE